MQDKKLNCWMEETKPTKKAQTLFVDTDYFVDARSRSTQWHKEKFF